MRPFGGWGYRQCQVEVDPMDYRPYTITPTDVPTVFSDDILLARPRWELLKIDYDYDDVVFLDHVLALVKAGAVDVRAFVIEFNDARGRGAIFQRVHELGYTVYKLNVHEGRRFFNADGYDIVNGFMPVGLDARRWTEVFMQRGIKSALRLAKGLSDAEYDDMLSGEIPEFFITRDELAEPAIPNQSKVPFAMMHGSPPSC